MRAYHVLIFGLVFAFGVTSAKPIDSPSQLGRDALDNLQKNVGKVMGSRDSDLISHLGDSKDFELAGKDDSDEEDSFPFRDFFNRQQKRISEGVNTVIKGATGVGENIGKFFRDSVPNTTQVRNRARGFFDSIFGGSN
ncbi:unnamed protein product [Allacma fusca]|uniref:Uncharacterized protein n=1 Tax=Allacma fusca TaxID=39272 RepID=A0A8J2L3V7_9HEXA|nr:unnamed protein product [Allacma fusca]